MAKYDTTRTDYCIYRDEKRGFISYDSFLRLSSQSPEERTILECGYESVEEVSNRLRDIKKDETRH